MATKKKVKVERKEYSNEQRTAILSDATANKLTAKQVQERHGVSPATYYSWRRKDATSPSNGETQGKSSTRKINTRDLGEAIIAAIDLAVCKRLDNLKITRA